MKNLIDIININEALVSTHPVKKIRQYQYYPETRKELYDTICELIESGNYDLNSIDISNVTNISEIFEKLNSKFHNYPGFNINNLKFNDWDVSNVENAIGLFRGCKTFTGEGLENWQFASLKYGCEMFMDCYELNFDLTRWDLGSLIDGRLMFYKCKKLNTDISQLYMPVLQVGHAMFYDCNDLTSYIKNEFFGKSLTDISYMFFNCPRITCKITSIAGHPKHTEAFSKCNILKIPNSLK